MEKRRNQKSASMLERLTTEDKHLSETYKMLFDSFDEQIRLADTKAQLTLAANALLTAAISVSSKGLIQRLSTNNLLERIDAILLIFLFAALIASVFLALLAARPILKIRQQSRSLFYFGHVAQVSEKEFLDEFRKQSSSEIQKSVLAQVHAKAIIANRKYLRVQWSINFLIFALFFWALLQIILFVQP